MIKKNATTKNTSLLIFMLCMLLTRYQAAAQCDSLISTAQTINGLPNGTYKLVVTAGYFPLGVY